MKHTSAAAWRLRQSNPVPDDAFDGAARDDLGRAAFERIITGAATPPSELDGVRRIRARSAPSRPLRSGRGLALRRAVPATAAVAAATAAAVALSGVSVPSQPRYTLDAFLTVYPPAHPGDAVAVLRQLAAQAAAQPAPRALGPVEYSSNRQWEYVGDNTPLNLNYFTRHSYTNQAWDALSGASAVHIVRNFDGKVFTSSYPAAKWSAQEGAWINPVTLPASPSALRHRLLFSPGLSSDWSATYTQHASGHPHDKGWQVQYGEVLTRSGLLENLRLERKACHCSLTNVRIYKVGPFGNLTWQVVFVSTAIRFMSGEPLSPAVHATMLRLLARIAAHPGRGYTYVYMGTATDHLGRTGVVIGQEQGNSGGPHAVGVQSLIFDPRTGALLDVANAQCDIPMGAIPRTTGQCTPTDYTEYYAPRAVSAVPHYKAHIPGLNLQAGGPYF